MIENPQSFEDYYTNYHRAMVDRVMNAITYRMSWQQAEEVVQEMWIAAYDAWDRCDEPEDKRGPWLIGILNNKILHTIRNRERCGRPVEVNVSDVTALAELAQDNEAPEELVAAMETAKAAGEALEVLRLTQPEFYEVVKLHRVDGLKLREVAEELDIPLQTARSRLSRGLKALGTPTHYGKTKKWDHHPTETTGVNYKSGHPWYVKYYNSPDQAPEPVYGGAPECPRETHYDLGGVPDKPNCPGLYQCPVCQNFHKRT